MRQEIKLSKDNDTMLLLEILYCDSLFVKHFHSPSFVNPAFRESAGQYPIKIKHETLYPNSEGSIDMKGLRKIIENNKCQMNIIFRESNGTLAESCYLPPAKGDDFYVREFVI